MLHESGASWGAMDPDFKRLGAELAASRKARGLTQQEVLTAAAVSRGTLQSIEAGKFNKVTASVRVVAGVLGWASGSIEAVLAGGKPTLTDPSPSVIVEQATVNPSGTLDDLPLRMSEALKGRRVDQRLINLPGGGNVIVLVTAEPNATPEQTQATLEGWERREGLLEKLGEELPDEPSDR